MPDFIRLQILPAQPTPLVALHSSAGQVADVPAQPMPLPATAPQDGEQLWAALPLAVQTSLTQLARLRPERPVTLWLDAQARAVAAWPWELLAPPEMLPFACAPETPLARAFPGLLPPPPQRPGPLRALAAAAAPRGAQPLDVRRALERLLRVSGGTLATREQLTVTALGKLAHTGDLDLLLVVAHGATGQLLLEDERGNAHPVAAADLATLLHGPRVPAFVLASCDGATEALPGESLAKALLRAGAPGVVAMRSKLPEEVSEAFLGGLLAALAAGEALEVAAARGRRRVIESLGAAGGGWALPVCWQRVPGRPLAALALGGGAARLAGSAGRAGVAAKLATGGVLGALAVAALHPLIAPLVAGASAAAALPAVVNLLNNLGLNIFAGYLGGALARVSDDTPARAADDYARAIQLIAAREGQAAAELDTLLRQSGALAIAVASMREDTEAARALLDGLAKDAHAHGEALAALGDDVRGGFKTLYRQGERIGATVTRTAETTEQIKRAVDDLRDGPERERRARVAELERRYLDGVIAQYRTVSLARFTEELKRGTGEDSVPTPTLDQIFTALTVDGDWVTHVHLKGTYSGNKIQKAREAIDRVRGLEQVAPARVRQLLVLKAREHGRDGRSLGNDTIEQPADSHKARYPVCLRRPRLASETFAPQRGAPAPRVVLLGDPGSGKSTLLRYTAIRNAAALAHGVAVELPGWTEPRVPLLLSLGKLNADLSADGDELRVLVAELRSLLDGQEQSGGLGGELTALLPRAIVLLDGLDELSAEAAGRLSPRERAARAIGALAGKLPHTPIVVTCRERPFRNRSADQPHTNWQRHFDDRRWKIHTVQPFAFGQVREFVRAWYRQSITDPSRLAAERAEDLIGQLSEPAPAGKVNPLREAISAGALSQGEAPRASPLLLTMLTIVHYNSDGRSLPRRRDLLYEKLVVLLLDTWEPSRSRPDYVREALAERLSKATGGRHIYPIQSLRVPLHQVAYEAHCTADSGGDGRGILRRGQIRRVMMEYFEEDRGLSNVEAVDITDRFLDVLRDDAGLLTRLDNNDYLLPHLTFQEYLAAWYLVGMRAQPMQKELYRHWRSEDRERWRVVIQLWMGLVVQKGTGPDHGAPWVLKLASAEDDDGLKQPVHRQRDALLAVECHAWLLEQGAFDTDRALRRSCRDQVRAALHSIIPLDRALTSADLHLPPAERARAAVFLARLGTDDAPADTRPGVCALPKGHDDAGYWAGLIPAGEYRIGTQPDPFQGETYTPATVRLSAFRVARYPVTVWQYRQFVQAGGYTAAEWWTPEGRTWLQPGGVRYSWQEQGRITQPYLWDAPDWTADSQPVVGVSWYEAMAFCSWLRARGRVEGWLPEGWTIVLPTEAQWEVAAQWDAARGEPRSWSPPDGELWQNCEEAGIGRTSPVGLFPQGASPCGALDMAGNAWEWCASAYAGYPGGSATPGDDFAPNRTGPTVRGGSYYLQNLRSGWGARVRDNPNARLVNGSFRVCVCSAPPS